MPGVAPAGEGGLLGLALSPDVRLGPHGLRVLHHRRPTTASPGCSTTSRSPPGEQLGAPDTVFKGIPKGLIHNGGRIAFGPDKMLYAGTGETGDTGLAQDKKSLGGKILRMTPDGRAGARQPGRRTPSVYSYGHRNVQGLAWDARTSGCGPRSSARTPGTS